MFIDKALRDVMSLNPNLLRRQLGIKFPADPYVFLIRLLQRRHHL